MELSEKNIISILMENERKVAHLYEIYAELLPKHKNLWTRLSHEEIEHAETISEAEKISDGNGKLFSTDKYLRGILKYVSDFLDEEIRKVKKQKLTQGEALETALRVERSVVENISFEIWQPKEKDVLRIFKRLNKETEGHIKTLMGEMKKL
jgi:hypothetical protein